ncbi:hypothetical protein H0H92_005410 [Tricholoma furcatifolium]|nr:hypothetical protein H0H92_005410 [Tricholoma furcatifolium]
MPSPYLPHAIYSVAIITLSIHLVNQRKQVDEDRSRIAAKTSILESIRDQLRSNKLVSQDELERLKRLATRSPERETADEGPHQSIRWKEVFTGRKRGEEFDKWEKKEVEKLQEELNK